MRRGARSLLARHAVGFALNFVGTLLLARALGPQAWGVYGVAFVTQIMFQGLLERGMVGYLVRSHESPDGESTGTALLVQAVTGLLLGGLVVGVAGPVTTFIGDQSL